MKCATLLTHHVLNIIVLNDSSKMTLRLLVILVLYDSNTNHKLNHIFEISLVCEGIEFIVLKLGFKVMFL